MTWNLLLTYLEYFNLNQRMRKRANLRMQSRGWSANTLIMHVINSLRTMQHFKQIVNIIERDPDIKEPGSGPAYKYRKMQLYSHSPGVPAQVLILRKAGFLKNR
jgi:hypothetical protein